MAFSWKRNLYVAWLGCFLTGVSFQLVMPFISLYIEEIDVPFGSTSMWAGIAISATALASALVSPLWGSMADRKGRKLMMVRAAFGMAFTMGALGFVTNIYQLIFFRLLNGLLSGYMPNATAMIASQVPQEKSGWALGTLATGGVAGSLIGPLIGGALADAFGYRMVFFVTGFLLLVNLIFTIFFIKEDFTPVKKEDVIPTKEIMNRVKSKQLLYGLFITTFIIQIVATSIGPILALYVRELNGSSRNISLISGLIASAPGITALISSPFLGRLGDKVGNQSILLGGLLGSILFLVPMAFVQTTWQLGFLRLMIGFCTGALMPSVNTLISKNTPMEGVSRIFSYNQMFQNFGVVVGPLMGSAVAGVAGFSSVFLVTGLFVVINFTISSLNFHHLKTHQSK